MGAALTGFFLTFQGESRSLPLLDVTVPGITDRVRDRVY
jgi:hypothetical protein